MSDGGDEEPLAGGLMNEGAVTRAGDVVRRPAGPNAEALHAVLRDLAAQGFDGAPVPLGLRADGREELRFIPGDVPVPPFPDWIASDAVLVSVGSLLRRYHDAAAAIALDPAVQWPDDLADPAGGPLLCHNDVCPENVVFRDGRPEGGRSRGVAEASTGTGRAAVALLDFEFAAPGRPVWDVAMTARYWVPLVDPESSVATGRQHLDRAARLRLFVEAYGLPRAEWPTVIPTLQTVNRVARRFVIDRMERDGGQMRRAHEANGGWERWDRVDRWVANFTWY